MSDCEIKVENSGGTTTIFVVGSLFEQESCDKLSYAYRKHLGQGYLNIVIDLSQCRAISSYGVGQLIEFNNSIKKLSGKLTYSGLRKDMKDIMGALLLDQILNLKD